MDDGFRIYVVAIGDSEADFAAMTDGALAYEELTDWPVSEGMADAMVEEIGREWYLGRH